MPGTLTLARVTADCEIGAAPEKAHDVADRTNGALRHHLPDNLRRAFTRWFDGDDQSVWIIRRIDVSVVIAVDAAPDEIAAVMTKALVGALASALRESGDGATTLRFDDRAAYLSQFVADATADRAWGRWYYAPLDGVRLLSRSAAIRTVLAQDPAVGLAALARLDDHALARVASAFGAEDETLLLRALASTLRADARPSGEVYAAAWSGWRRALRFRVDRGRALFAYVRAADGAPSGGLQQAVLAIGDALSAAPGIAALAEDGESVPLPRAFDSPAEPITTFFGGLLLLLRDLDACPWAEWTTGWPMWDAVPPAALLKWLILTSCAGRSASVEATRDPLLRLYFDIPLDLTIGDAASWLRLAGARRRSSLARHVAEVDESAATQSPAARRWLTMGGSSGIGASWSATLASATGVVLWRFAQRLPGFAESTPEHLWRNFLDFDAVVDLEPDRVVVRCGRSPLHLVLTLTGMTRGLLTGHDASGRPWLLFSRD